MSGSLCHNVSVRLGVGGVDKNFNLGYTFQTRRGCAFILHMCISCDKTFQVVLKFFYLVTLTLNIDLLLKNFNLGLNFQTRRGRAFILHMCIACDKTFHIVP